MLTKLKLIVLFLYVHCASTLFVRYTPVVEISQGKLRGFRGLNGQNRYYGIPYGVAERFQPPKQPRKWSGVFQALWQFDSCAQAVSVFQFGAEDCLKLDVYTPAHASRGHKLPILVFFHGGAYYYGGKWHYEPEFLVTNNIIVIIVNYRVGVLGFLCLNNVANLGLKDQVAALKWIQKNIAAFGGDPDNVTISGQSAGASSSSLHFLSKHSRGLFHKAILMSGAPLTPWAFNLEPLTPAMEDAAKIGTIKNEYDAFNTFLKAPLDDILAATHGTSIDTKYFKYAPCEDANFTEPFFHDTPYNIIKSGDFNKVPMIIGFTSLEGVLFYGLNNQRTLEYLDNTFPERLPSTFSWCSDKDKQKIANKIRLHYFGEHNISSAASAKGTVQLYSDWIAYATLDAFSALVAEHSPLPVYNYLFAYEGGRNFAKRVFERGLGLQGASHSDDIFYIYKPAGLTPRLTHSDKLMVDRFTTMLTNFMKYGDPTPSMSALLPVRWPPTTGNHSRVLRIDRRLSVSDMPEQFKGDFFLRLLCEHGLSGYVPCDSAMNCNKD